MFIAYANGYGDCGQELWRLESTTHSGAIAELKYLVFDEWDPDFGYENILNARYLETITLFEIIAEQKIPLDNWYSEAEDRERILNDGIAAKKELAEFKRLRAKFGGAI